MRGLGKKYGGFEAVAGLDLEIQPGEFFTLLGPSGSGKTTPLMMLAGFTEPTSGTVVIDGSDVARTAPERRDIGVVFQNYALFPHMSVAENLAYSLTTRRRPRDEVARKVDWALDLVDLAALRDQLPAALSGGQQQRVAVARAVVFDPALLLMDEPLGALDRKLRLRLQTEVRALQRRLGLTVVYVTHDQDEAMSMSDRIAVMDGGHVEQVGSAEELYDDPATLFVAGFLGDNNLWPAHPVDASSLLLEDGTVIAVGFQTAPAGSVVAAVRPERLRLAPVGADAGPGAAASGPSGRGVRGVVSGVRFLGSVAVIDVDVPGLGAVRVDVQRTGSHRSWSPGDEVEVSWRVEDLRVFPADATTSDEADEADDR
jgi:ABC-type Fe3+/spermidine/putrescine transport system ATPase subunit